MKINEDVFWTEYKPQINHFERDSQPYEIADEDLCSWGGCMYETFGKEVDYIRQLVVTHSKNVWTIIDVEDKTIVSSGFHIVDRVGYIITEKPWENENDEVEFDIEERYIQVDQKVTGWIQFSVKVPDHLTSLEFAEEMKLKDPQYNDQENNGITFVFKIYEVLETQIRDENVMDEILTYTNSKP